MAISGTTPNPPRNPPGTLKSLAATKWRRAVRFVMTKLAWNRLYRAASYLRSALWIVPFIAIVLVLATAPVLRFLDARFDWEIVGLAPAGAQALFQTVITLTLSFLVFTFSSLLVAIQVASAQLTPRIIATLLLRDNVVRYSVGLFVFTLVFAVSASNRPEANVHQLIALFAGVLGIACVAAFLFLIDYAARLLRPVSVVAHVGDKGLAVIESVYTSSTAAEPGADDAPREPTGPPRRVTRHDGASGIVLAIDVATLVDGARRVDGLIEFVPHVGDFIASGEPLFALHAGATAIDDRQLQATVAFGSERTMEQDPMFAFRILVDIALKALSPAINDPTTAILAIDQLHRLLRELGKRHLGGEEIADDSGRRRVILRTPDWEDFVQVACTEIRSYGAANVQVARRLRAMFDNLAQSLPPRCHAALQVELGLLDRTIESLYHLPEDLALARIPDSQGLGSHSGKTRSR